MLVLINSLIPFVTVFLLHSYRVVFPFILSGILGNLYESWVVEDVTVDCCSCDGCVLLVTLL